MTRADRRIVIALVVAVLLTVSVSIAQNAPPTASGQEMAKKLPNAAPPLVEEPKGEPVAVIPPGQEELLSDMMGRGVSLAGGCKLTGGDVNGSTLRATYQCSGGEVVMELVHPSQVSRNATKTERFALAPQSGTPPDGLVTELVERIRSREARFEWKWLEGPPRARTAPPTTILIAAGVVLAAGATLAIWALRRRRA